MKNTPLTTVLLGVLAASALLSFVLFWFHNSNTKELRTLQIKVNNNNNKRAMITAMANDTLEYSKTHPAIDPVLVSLGFKPDRTNPTATPKPAAK